MTERLYYRDSYLKDFEARILERFDRQGRPAIILDRTAFYPSSGGQPHDTGLINGVRVLDVMEEEGKIVHLMEEKIEGERAKGTIDWMRRWDHMQQHTGQHILSQAFIRTLQAETIGFHLGETVSSIDLNIKEIGKDDLWQTEDLANEVIQSDRPISIIFADEEGAKKFFLRKEVERKGEIRIVAIKDFDASPCGGTHLKCSGEVGLIKIRKWEKVGSKMRIDFLAGRRALLDYRWKNDLVQYLAHRFTTADNDLKDTILKLEKENRTLKRRLKKTGEILMSYEAEELYQEADIFQGYRIVRKIFSGREPRELKILASALKKKKKVISLIGHKGEGALLIFSRSSDIALDLSSILKKSVELIGGRGGGKNDLAQGGSSDASSVEEAIHLAWALVRKELS